MVVKLKLGLHLKIFTYPKVEQVGIPSVKVMYLKREGNVDGTYFTSFSTLSNYIVHSQILNLDLGENVILHQLSILNISICFPRKPQIKEREMAM